MSSGWARSLVGSTSLPISCAAALARASKRWASISTSPAPWRTSRSTVSASSSASALAGSGRSMVSDSASRVSASRSAANSASAVLRPSSQPRAKAACWMRARSCSGVTGASASLPGGKPALPARGRKPALAWVKTKLPRLAAPSPLLRMSLDIIVTPPGEHQRAGVGETARGGEHVLLCLVDLGEAQRTALGHFVADRIGGAGRHATEHFLAQFLLAALERDDQHVILDVAQQDAEILVVQRGEIVEDEHLVLDLLGELLVRLGERADDALVGAGAHIVHDLGGLAGAAAGRGRRGRHPPHLGDQDPLELLERLGADRFELGDAVDQVGLGLGRQQLQHVGGDRRLEMGKDDRGDLRML